MESVSFPSRDTAEVIDVEFLTLQGTSRTIKLLVDTGFSEKAA